MKQLLSFKWILTTILVVVAVGVMVRLGIWQLERLKWRQAFNEHYIAQVQAPVLNLNEEGSSADLVDMEYRQVHVQGVYDFDHEVYLQNQVYDNLPGYHVLTPLRIDGSTKAVIINRGWIPMNLTEAAIQELQAPAIANVSGVIRLGLEDTDFKNGLGTIEADGTITYWKYINITQLSKQLPYQIEPIYIETEVQPAGDYPVPSFKEIEITQGPHLGYAFQWFFFAVLLGGGYPAFLRKTLAANQPGQGEKEG